MLIRIPNSDIKHVKRSGGKESKSNSDIYVNPDKIICLEGVEAVLSEGTVLALTNKGMEDLIKATTKREEITLPSSQEK